MQHQCSRCLLDTEIPGVRIESSGLCSVCTSYDKLWGLPHRYHARRNIARACEILDVVHVYYSLSKPALIMRNRPA